jgi:hypothetical protein
MTDIPDTRKKLKIKIQIIILLINAINNNICIHKNYLLMIFVDQSMRWDENEITQKINILILVYNSLLC